MVRGKGFSGFWAEVLSRWASEERRLLTQNPHSELFMALLKLPKP